jgi:hypothetical protein
VGTRERVSQIVVGESLELELAGSAGFGQSAVELRVWLRLLDRESLGLGSLHRPVQHGEDPFTVAVSGGRAVVPTLALTFGVL